MPTLFGLHTIINYDGNSQDSVTQSDQTSFCGECRLGSVKMAFRGGVNIFDPIYEIGFLLRSNFSLSRRKKTRTIGFESFSYVIIHFRKL